MGTVSPGFAGRMGHPAANLPPGQYLTRDFPVLSAGPTPRVPLDRWRFTVETETGVRREWSWSDLLALPSDTVTVEIHCVTKWSKLGTTWQGIRLDTLLADVDTAADFALVHSYGGYTTNLPLEDLLDARAWIAYRYDSEPPLMARMQARAGCGRIGAVGALPVYMRSRPRRPILRHCHSAPGPRPGSDLARPSRRGQPGDPLGSADASFA